jgi:hypothetical protein
LDAATDNQAMLKTSGPALGARLKAALISAKVSVPDVAAACNRSEAAVYGWFKTGRIAKEHLPTLARLTGKSIGELLGGAPMVDVQPATKTEVLEVELPRDAIDLARSWMVLPENERNEFRRKIETAALRYRDHVSDTRMQAWGKTTAAAGPKKPPKGGGTQ